MCNCCNPNRYLRNGNHNKFWKIFSKNGKLKDVYWGDDRYFFKVKDKDFVVKYHSKNVIKIYKITKCAECTDLLYYSWIPTKEKSIAKLAYLK
jgi:hypothetical protein